MRLRKPLLRTLLGIFCINKRPASLQAFVLYGAGTRSRTRDLLITSQLLYQLSYTG